MDVWIDVGGTFTDCFVLDPSGGRQTRKVLSSAVTKAWTGAGCDRSTVILPSRCGDGEEFWRGFELALVDADGNAHQRSTVAHYDQQTGAFLLDSPLDEAPEAGRSVELSSDLEAPVLAVRRALGLGMVHDLPRLNVRLGTTRGTNALLTRTGADVGLLITEGFGDLLRIGSQERPELFSLDICKPPPLTERVFEVPERLAADGSVLKSLQSESVISTLDQWYREGVRSLAICLLHAYQNDEHERQLERLALQQGFTEISRSSQVAPLIKLLTRAETTTLDAYLNPVLSLYIDRVWQQFGGPDRTTFRLMTSGGQLVAAESFRGRDSVLSGPAGGVVALASIGNAARRDARLCEGVIGLDMGGTSTDVSRFEGTIVRQFESRKAGVRIMTPMIAIHTVAAGGGSVCRLDQGRLLVGPESAGADPGPACYGRGGPLAVTDLNLVLGRIAEDQFPFRLDAHAAQGHLRRMADQLEQAGTPIASVEHLAEGFWEIAVNHMAEAVRTVTTAEGSDPRPMALVSFGGAAGQHACAVAEALGMRCVIDHPDASMFSALGMGLAPIGRTASRGIYQPLDEIEDRQWTQWLAELTAQATSALEHEAIDTAEVQTAAVAELRYAGTETTLQIDAQQAGSLGEAFAATHQRSYGYVRRGRPIEVVSLRVDTRIPAADQITLQLPEDRRERQGESTQPLFIQGRWSDAMRFNRSSLESGDRCRGPALIVGHNSTLVVHPNWEAVVDSGGSLIVQNLADAPSHATALESGRATKVAETGEQLVQMEIAGRRLQGIAEQMGEVLRRTAVSVNVKERLDYSCAIFRGDGTLVAGAMHVPVHLGAMGHTVRSILKSYPQMYAGDCYVSNNPYAGGSHLPDVTVITPVFVRDQQGSPDFLVASRAHHAEIGGMTPGSMPPGASTLGEEGVVIHNFALHREGQGFEEQLLERLRGGAFPSRTPAENMADIAAQVAAGQRGAGDLRTLSAHYGFAQVDGWMQQLLRFASTALDPVLDRLGSEIHRSREVLIDESEIEVALQVCDRQLVVDFTGTSGVHPRGWNATPAIVSAAVLYVLRCLSDRPLPLSEGILSRLQLIIPPGLLNPPPGEQLETSPAVVAGNVETSQRVVDGLLSALAVAASSQGTMNNVLIGDAQFGYYETICGGAGATPNGPGADAVHTHMTNTRITDPEVLELRYPLRLREFSIRRGSGGRGLHRGGDGAVREFEMLRPLTLSLLTSRREPPCPSGLQGGHPGSCGSNLWIHTDGTVERLPATASLTMQSRDRLRIETPGGGGFGTPPE